MVDVPGVIILARLRAQLHVKVANSEDFRTHSQEIALGQTTEVAYSIVPNIISLIGRAFRNNFPREWDDTRRNVSILCSQLFANANLLGYILSAISGDRYVD